ncbi:hypothetical protein [Flammeovirga aprica]|uniref:Lipoprotein n=1 Tax=Flammeovirga aprica JL-4 TaxID=694437 RepID=A0A7X9S1G9_9BACT|nr:hypothetical protein [Flammeovirga aprica]NME72427.1 hypothetical protein [Flammeovirga aprica JL-4]
MKLNPIILYVLLLFSCNNKAQIEFGKRYTEKLLQVNIDTLGNYQNWHNTVDSMLCNNDYSQIQLLICDQEVNYKINLNNHCSDDVVCFTSRNFLTIQNDSIYKYNIGAYSFDSLCDLILRDYPNNGLNPRLSEAPHKFVLSFIQPNLLDHKTVKERLVRVLEAFKRTELGNENLKLSLGLDLNENFDFDKIQYEDSIYREMEMLLEEQDFTL